MMANPLVCVKRVVDSSGEVVLTEDGQGVDGRYAGFTMSAHEECAVELAVQVAAAGDGSATVMTLGDADAVEQLRAALAVGCTAATHVVADSQAFGPADVAREIAAVVRDHEAAGTPHELVLLGNDAADSGDFQVGIRLAYELGWPVVNGVSTVSVADGEVTASGAGPDGHETYRLPLPAVVTILEGGVEPRYPTVPGRMKAKKAPVEEREPGAAPAGASRAAARAPATHPVERRDPRRGSVGRTRGRRPLRAAGGAGPMILVLVEVSPTGEAVETSLEAITFARDLAAAGGGIPIDAVVVGAPGDDVVEGARRRTACAACTPSTGPAYDAYSGAALGRRPDGGP